MGDMMFEDLVKPLVHMGVVSCCLGKHLQTIHSCYLENRHPWFFYCVLSFSILNQQWCVELAQGGPALLGSVQCGQVEYHQLAPACQYVQPESYIVQTGRGSIMHSCMWQELPWDTEMEKVVL